MTERSDQQLDGHSKVHVREREQVVARPLEEVFEFFSLARNLEASATASGTRCRSARSASLRDA